ncbi:hypothetical protein Vafri_13773 [Volvox africanus]|uniref:Peptidase M11 gametolysin domain-containing protein n=1 Tax=Volvox africanus TaxID=51714 RepID=A0A8J4BHI6_9CHLO|nr:hypothetical protein Vafri_13773 [Volvox africanus]
MELRGPFLAALLLTACVTLPSALSQVDSSDAPPSSSSSSSSSLDVTVYVEGMVQVYGSYSSATADIGLVNHMRYVPPEYSYTLVEASVDNNEPLNEVPVAFSEELAGSLRTGDVVQAALKLKLSSEQASDLGLGFDDDGSAGGGRRRLLTSEAHEQARRMVLDFHETRRSLQEFMTLTDILNAVAGITLSELPLAENPVIIGQSDTIKDLFIENGKQQNVSSLTFVVKSTICGLQPKLDANAVRKYWFDNSSDKSLTATLQQYHKACTYDQLAFRPANNLVIDIDIPCNGTLPGSPLRYDLVNGYGGGRSDMMNEMLALPKLALEALRTTNPTLAAKFKEYRRQMYIFPFGWMKYISFDGMSSQGCTPTGPPCLAIINSAVYGLSSERLPVPVVFHELGHNIGLPHANGFSCKTIGKCEPVEFGDVSDIMGYGSPSDLNKTVLCLNAALAGWAAPIPGGHLSLGASLKPGMPQDFVLPSMSLKKENMLRIITDATNPSVITTTTNSQQVSQQRAIFVSYRVSGVTPASFDSGLGRNGSSFYDLDGYVWVHEFNETANGQPTTTPSLLLAKLDTSRGVNSFTQQLPTSLGSVTIKVKSKTADAARVTVCRAIRVNETGPNSCSDGLDNDCDGLVDNEDPDCNPSLRPPPPATSPPPKPLAPRPPSKVQPSPPRKAPAKKKRPPPHPKHTKKPSPKKNRG